MSEQIQIFRFQVVDSSGHEPNSPNVAENVADDDPISRWSHEQIGAYVTMDMGEVRLPVRAIGIQWYYPEGQERRKSTFSVEISIDNTSTFRQILSDKESSGDHSMEYYEFDQDYDARYIKLIV
ncbi:MAG: discoidin domain-containing protein, partial [Candidatus Nitrosocosmicus sp.]